MHANVMTQMLCRTYAWKNDLEGAEPAQVNTILYISAERGVVEVWFYRRPFFEATLDLFF
jgi:hypothetical protein